MNSNLFFDGFGNLASESGAVFSTPSRWNQLTPIDPETLQASLDCLLRNDEKLASLDSGDLAESSESGSTELDRIECIALPSMSTIFNSSGDSLFSFLTKPDDELQLSHPSVNRDGIFWSNIVSPASTEIIEFDSTDFTSENSGFSLKSATDLPLPSDHTGREVNTWYRFSIRGDGEFSSPVDNSDEYLADFYFDGRKIGSCNLLLEFPETSSSGTEIKYDSEFIVRSSEVVSGKLEIRKRIFDGSAISLDSLKLKIENWNV